MTSGRKKNNKTQPIGFFCRKTQGFPIPDWESGWAQFGSKYSYELSNDVQAEKKKELGNECMKKEKYVEAMFHYTEAIKMDPKIAAIHTNRFVQRCTLADC